MITRPQGFMVIGTPVPQGDLTCRGGKGKHKLYHSNDKTLKPWRDLITAAALRWIDQTAPEGQPLEVMLTWSLKRPNDHYGTGRNADRLKDSAPIYPTTRPDVDKLTRAVLDAVKQSGRIHDDALATDAYVRKRYAGTRGVSLPAGAGPDRGDVLPVPGLVVRIYPMTEDS
jgi:Holliday junction resolvase RusA-like endonuclease